jgi:hypothetical protein
MGLECRTSFFAMYMFEWSPRAHISLHKEFDIGFGVPSALDASMISFPVLDIQLRRGSVRTLVPPPSANADDVRMSCRTSEDWMNRSGDERSEIKVGMRVVRALKDNE